MKEEKEDFMDDTVAEILTLQNVYIQWLGLPHPSKPELKNGNRDQTDPSPSAAHLPQLLGAVSARVPPLDRPGDGRSARLPHGPETFGKSPDTGGEVKRTENGTPQP